MEERSCIFANEKNKMHSEFFFFLVYTNNGKNGEKKNQFAIAIRTNQPKYRAVKKKCVYDCGFQECLIIGIVGIRISFLIFQCSPHNN